jgi:hypothetical protein
MAAVGLVLSSAAFAWERLRATKRQVAIFRYEAGSSALRE